MFWRDYKSEVLPHYSNDRRECGVVWVWLYIVQGVAIYFSHSGGAARKEGGKEGEGDEGPSQAQVGLGQVTEIEI
jgi:hypothetical protein